MWHQSLSSVLGVLASRCEFDAIIPHYLEFPPFFLSLCRSLHLRLFPRPRACMRCSLWGSAVRQTDIQLENRLGPCGRLQRSKPPASAVAGWFVPSDCSLDRFSVSVSCRCRRLVFLHDISWNLQTVFTFTWIRVNWVCQFFFHYMSISLVVVLLGSYSITACCVQNV